MTGEMEIESGSEFKNINQQEKDEESMEDQGSLDESSSDWEKTRCH